MWRPSVRTTVFPSTPSFTSDHCRRRGRLRSSPTPPAAAAAAALPASARSVVPSVPILLLDFSAVHELTVNCSWLFVICSQQLPNELEVLLICL